MERNDLLALMSREFDELVRLNEKKGHDYAGDEDALSNFKEMGRRLKLEPEQIWAVYADKHWSAIMTFCSEGQVQSEPIEGRIRDVMVYCFLLMGLIQDRKDHELRTNRHPSRGDDVPC